MDNANQTIKNLKIFNIQIKLCILASLFNISTINKSKNKHYYYILKG